MQRFNDSSGNYSSPKQPVAGVAWTGTMKSRSLIFRRLPQEIHAARAQLRDIQTEVELDVVRRTALAKHGEKIRDVVALAVFNQVGVLGTDAGDALRPFHCV